MALKPAEHVRCGGGARGRGDGSMSLAMRDALDISSGTMAALTGLRHYQVLDQIHRAFIEYVERTEGQGRIFTTWAEAWAHFWMGVPA